MLGRIPYPVLPVVGGGRRHHYSSRLGAEELIELGQLPSTSPSSSPSLRARAVALSAVEAKLLISVVESLVSFASDYEVEYQAYCPPDRWKKSMEEVGTWSVEIDQELKGGATQVTIPADMILRLVDLEKCVSAARDARLSSSRWAFTLSAIGAIADFAFGITWLGVPMYIAGLGLLFGRPLYAKYQAKPLEPFAPALSGYWVEYVGPATAGLARRAGPFGCTADSVSHAMGDAGFLEAGVDGGYVIFDGEGNVVKEKTL